MIVRFSICFLAIFTLLTASSTKDTQHYVFFGETGSGKSQTISTLGEVDAPTGDIESTTMSTMCYQTTASSFFKGAYACDTRGIFDTHGKTNDEVMGSIENYYLQYNKTSNKIDAFIIMLNGNSNRIRFTDLFTLAIQSFSESILRSVVIVINRFQQTPKEDFDKLEKQIKTNTTAKLLNKYPGNGYQLPVVILDAKNPSPSQKKELEDALKKVSPYQLVDLDKKLAKIREIYANIIKDPENYKTLIDKIVEEEKRIVEKEVVVRGLVEVTETSYEGCKWSVNIKFFSYCHPNKVETKKFMPKDEIKKVNEAQMVPTIKNVTQSVLKNEENVYWAAAVKKYQEEVKITVSEPWID